MEIVITGIGVVSPIGIGREAFWQSLCDARSGVGLIESFDASKLPIRMAAEVRDFVPKKHVANRKALKVMSRDAKLGVAAARLAREEAALDSDGVDPDRMGVVLGADRICSDLGHSQATYSGCMVDGEFYFDRWGVEGLSGSFPLSFLRVLPNMVASHVSIAEDARGPNNTIHQMEISSLQALSEAARAIERGVADVMIAGGASSALNPFDCARHNVMGFLTSWQGDPERALCPFDAKRTGQVWGEGAGVLILENRTHAEARGAKIYGRLLGWGEAGESTLRKGGPTGSGLRQAMRIALKQAGLRPEELGHVNAHGVSTVRDDALEAKVLRDVVGEVPVTAPKSYFGNLGAAGGGVEMAVSLLALEHGCVPPTLNYDQPDPECPVQVIHDKPLDSSAPALLVNWTAAGQASAMVVAAEG